jgi:hypothetical protein
MATVGAAASPPAAGIAWVDVPVLEREGEDLKTWGDGLGPVADEALEAGAGLRRVGLEARPASAVISIGGSYAFGVRVDGVDGQRLARTLDRAGAVASHSGDWTLYDIGDQGDTPRPLQEAGMLGLGARSATSDRQVVIASNGDARASLIGEGTPYSGDASFALAASCLGDVVAARILPAGRFLRSAEIGADLLAMGVERDGSAASADGPTHEVLCAIGDSAEGADRDAAALRRSLEPTARDLLTDQRIGDLIASSSITRVSAGDLEGTRVRLELARSTPPGFLFDTLTRGSLAAYLGLGEPHRDIPADF